MQPADISDRSGPRGPALKEIATLFLKLGLTAFGGPAAHIAMMEAEVVRRRGWMTHEEFMDLVSVTHLIPGPNSTEMAIHVGLRRGGWPGFFIAGACFILPATLIVTGLAWVYVRFGALPQMEGVFRGVQPVIVAIMAQAVWVLARVLLKRPPAILLMPASLALMLAGLNEIAVLLAAGTIALLARDVGRKCLAFLLTAPVGVNLPGLASAAGGVGGAAPFSLATLFVFFLKVGSVLYGSGYVLIAFLQADLVERRGWLSERELLDAVAAGQFTPGPVLNTAAFIGYLLGGGAGAALATLGIFLPAFVFVALSGSLVARLRAWPAAGVFLDGVNAAALALMTGVMVQLAAVSVKDPVSLLMALGSLGLLLRHPVNSTWLILAGGLIGLARSWVS